MGASAAGVIVSVTPGYDHTGPCLCFQAGCVPLNSLASNNRHAADRELGGRWREKARLWKAEINRAREKDCTPWPNDQFIAKSMVVSVCVQPKQTQNIVFK